MTTMLAFHGKTAIKRKYLSRVRAHRKADQIVHGIYWEKGKGCAVGCTVHSGDHGAYETELGIPRILARLEDGIFESLSNGRALEWPEQFLSAIKIGADLSAVWPKFAVWLMIDAKYGVLQFAKTERSKKAIQDVAAAYKSVVDGKAERPNWQKLRAAAHAAAVAAVAAAAHAAAAAVAAVAHAAAAAVAAVAAAAAAADAAADAADAAACAADADAAKISKRQEWRIAQADKLLELLRTA